MNDGVAILSNSGSAVIGFFINYLIEKKKEDKKVEEAAQEIVWKQNEVLKGDYRTEIGSLREMVEDYRKEFASTEREVERYRKESQKYQDEAFESKRRMQICEVDMAAKDKEIVRLEKENSDLRARLAS